MFVSHEHGSDRDAFVQQSADDAERNRSGADRVWNSDFVWDRDAGAHESARHGDAARSTCGKPWRHASGLEQSVYEFEHAGIQRFV